MKKRTRIAALLAAAVTLSVGIGVLPVKPAGDGMMMVSAETYDVLTYSSNGSYITITGCDSAASEVVIPAEIDGVPVTQIGEKAFYQCEALTSVILPEGLKTINSSAFYGCTGLTAIDIPDTVVYIMDYAFYGCTNLEAVTVSEKLQAIDDYAFYQCSSLKEFDFPDGLTTIGSNAFRECSKLTAAVLPVNVSSFGDSVFYGCSSLTTLTLPENLYAIPYYAFGGCSSLSSIVIPENVKSINMSAFEKCTSLISVTLPASIYDISSDAFSGCYITDIYYAGTEEEWDAIYKTNSYLLYENIHFSSTAPTEPTTVPPTDPPADDLSLGDLSGDGTIDAVDAALILQYAADKGAGSQQTLMEFLQEKGYRLD